MDASKLMEALKGLMDALKGKGGGGGGGAPPANTDPCAALSSVTRDANAAVLINPTNSSTSPCVNGQFTPLLSDQLGSLNQGTGGGGLGDALLRALGATGSGSSFDSGSGEEDAGGGEEESSNVSDILGGVSGDAEDADAKEGDAESTNAADKKGAKATIIKGGVVSLEPSTEGDIYIGEGGAMIFARSRDPKSNTEVAGFYGGSTGSESASKGLIGRLCTTRPWSAGFLSKVIPPSFFDGLCTRAGYQVGVVVTESGGAPAGKRTSAPAPQKQKTNPVNLPTVQPEVDIWAEPANVRLGTRTYIFWNTKGVVSCTVSGPSFTQSALSGGASTVPLSDASTFTLECKTAGDVVVTDSVRVNLAI